MNYIVVSDNFSSKLQDNVNRNLGLGYELVGGIAVTVVYGVPTYYQAMIKR